MREFDGSPTKEIRNPEMASVRRSALMPWSNKPKSRQEKICEFYMRKKKNMFILTF